jgi:hypothetical protein
MRKADNEALARGEKVRTIHKRTHRNDSTGETRIYFFEALMWVEERYVYFMMFDDIPLTKDKVVTYYRNNGLPGSEEYAAYPQDLHYAEGVDEKAIFLSNYIFRSEEMELLKRKESKNEQQN